MNTKKMKEMATDLYAINQKIKELTELAEGHKRTLREFLPEEGIEIEGMTCRKVTQTTPEINNKKLYKLMTYEELVQATKPIMSEIKRFIGEEQIEKCAAGWKVVECIKFFPTKEK